MLPSCIKVGGDTWREESVGDVSDTSSIHSHTKKQQRTQKKEDFESERERKTPSVIEWIQSTSNDQSGTQSTIV